MKGNEMLIPALLLGRKGSQGFPGKNTIDVLGNPMASYPMKAALATQEIGKVYLSTDDPKLMEIAKINNVEVIERPDYLCTNEALGEDAYVHGYEEILRRNADKTVEYLVLLFCNSPTVSTALISEGIKVLRENREIDSAVSVSRYNMWSPLRARKINDKGLLSPFVPFEVFGDPTTLNCDRDSQGNVWFADMSVSVVRATCLENISNGMLPQKWMGQNIYPLKQEAGLDVDYPWQVPQVEYWLRNQQNNGGW